MCSQILIYYFGFPTFTFRWVDEIGRCGNLLTKLIKLLFVDDGESFDPRVAALLAVHLVGQVLDEAYVIAVAAHESGRRLRTK